MDIDKIANINLLANKYFGYNFYDGDIFPYRYYTILGQYILKKNNDYSYIFNYENIYISGLNNIQIAALFFSIYHKYKKYNPKGIVIFNDYIYIIGNELQSKL